MWPHHCLQPSRRDFSFPREDVRLNHYATGDEGSWRDKCSQSNPTFKGNSRRGRAYCEQDPRGGMSKFWRRLTNHTDLFLFQMLGRGGERVPEAFLERARPGPTLQEELLARHCRHHMGTLKGAAVALCAAEAGPLEGGGGPIQH